MEFTIYCFVENRRLNNCTNVIYKANGKKKSLFLNNCKSDVTDKTPWFVHVFIPFGLDHVLVALYRHFMHTKLRYQHIKLKKLERNTLQFLVIIEK